MLWGVQSPPKLPPPRVQEANGEYMGLNSAKRFSKSGPDFGNLAWRGAGGTTCGAQRAWKGLGFKGIQKGMEGTLALGLK